MNTDKFLETDLNALDENVNSVSKSNLSMSTLKKQGLVENLSATVSSVPRLSAREVSHSSCRRLLSRIGLLSAHRRNHKKSRPKSEQNKWEHNSVNNNMELDLSPCAQQAARNLQVLDNSETFFSPSVELGSNLLDPILVSEPLTDSPVASTSRQRISRQKMNQESTTKRFDVLAGSNAGSDSTPLVDFKATNSTTSRRLRHPTDEKVDAMRFDSSNGRQQSRSLLESSSHFATAMQLGSRQVDQTKCLSGNSSFCTSHMLPTEVSPRGSVKGGGAHTSFTQLGFNSSTTGPPACQTLRDAKSVLRKHAPANPVSAASSTHVAINSVIGLSLHSFHPTNSFHSRSSSFRSRRTCVRRGVMASDAEDSIQDRDLSMIGATAVASASPSAELFHHGVVSQKMQYPAHSARTHEGLVDRSFRSFPKGPLDAACTPFSHRTSDIIALPSEQQGNPNCTCGHALQSIVMVPGSDPSFGQVRSPQLIFEMLDTSSITSFNPEETAKELSVSNRSLSSGSAIGMPLRARIMGPKLVRRLSSRSAQSIDNSNTSDSDVEAEHQKKVDELLRLLTADRRPHRSNSLAPEDPLSRTSNTNTGNSGDMTTGGFARVDGVASASHNTVNCMSDLITGSTETALDPAANSSCEDKGMPNSSGWMCVGSLFSSQDWYMRMQRKKDDDGTEKEVELTSRGFDKDKERSGNTCNCSGGSGSIALPLASGDADGKSVLSSPGKVPLVDKSDEDKPGKSLPRRKTSCTYAENHIAVKENIFETCTDAEDRQCSRVNFNSKSDRLSSPMENCHNEQPQVQDMTLIIPQNGPPAVSRLILEGSVPLGDQKLHTEKHTHQIGNNATSEDGIVGISCEAPILAHHEFNVRVLPTIREPDPPLSPASQKAANVPQTPVISHVHEVYQVSTVPGLQSSMRNRQVSNSSNNHLPDTMCDHSTSTSKRISSGSSREKINKHPNKGLERVRLEPVTFSPGKAKRIKKKTRERSTILPTASNVCTDSVGKHDKVLLPKGFCIDEASSGIHATTDVSLPVLPYDHLKVDSEPTSSGASIKEADPPISPESTISRASCSSGDGKVTQDFLAHCNQARRRTIPHYTNTTKMDSLIDESLKVGSDSRVSPLQKKDSSAAMQGGLLHITWPMGVSPTSAIGQHATSPNSEPCRKASLPQVKSAKLQAFAPPNMSRRTSVVKSKLGSNSKLRPSSPGVVLPQWKSSDTSKPALSSASVSKNIASGSDADFNTVTRTRILQPHCSTNVDDQAMA
ncbi:unnamed protein product [Phytomonas sp. EM1]|nr:unnamed protein product [Phytomonas sp. EM1]|eukprot:CCW60815.1 unnamed protein product [Phytomonas sp. isolate EM1]